MDRKRTRLQISLSRKRKKEITDGEDTNREFCVVDENSENIVMSSNTSVDSKEKIIEAQNSQENAAKVNFTARIPESSKAVYTHHNNSKKSIATWFKKSHSPKTVSCPMCGKVVLLSKINQHLDNNCNAHVQVPVESNSTYLFGSSFQKDEKENVSAISDDKTVKSNGCKSDVQRPLSRGENLAPLEVSSISDPTILDPNVAPLGIKSKSVDINMESCGPLNEDDGVEYDDNDKQEGSSTEYVAATEEEKLSRKDGTLQTKQRDTSTDQTNKEHNKILHVAEETSKISKAQEPKDHEPYYLANFKLVLNNVLSNNDDRQLFNEPDNGIIDTFNGMSPEEQKLYIRLFQRKRGWFRCSKLEYPKISSNLTPILNSLVQKGKVE